MVTISADWPALSFNVRIGRVLVKGVADKSISIAPVSFGSRFPDRSDQLPLPSPAISILRSLPTRAISALLTRHELSHRMRYRSAKTESSAEPATTDSATISRDP